MKVSLNTVKYYLGGDVWPDVDDLVQKIGAQLGAVEDVIDYSKRYEGIIVARVVKCEKHPNADKLSVCQIDVGTVENIQVVCGAPNVREGLIVAWIPPGATVPATAGKDPFILDSRELRGVMSNGMLASPSELGINSDHSGLLEIDEQVVGSEKTIPGTAFKNLYGLNDWIIDLENKMFTHRPDCFGVLGVAREFAGIYGKNFDTPDWFLKIPKIFLDSSDAQNIDKLKLEIKNELPDLVPRFMAVAMSDVKIEPSPLWVQALLTRVGIKPINNIVDMTNHLAYVTGQPLHAYDYDKVKALSNSEQATLIVRSARQGDKIKLLNGKEIEPTEGTIMIATDNVAIGIGGVMGGSDTEVDENTRSIIIECANFDMYSIRRASMAHGLFTDAVTKFNKGQSPLQNDRVIVKMMEDVKQVAGGEQASNFIDLRNFDEQIYRDQAKHKAVVTTTDFINARLGLSLSKEDIMSFLRNVGFACLEKGESAEIEFYAPFWRMDIEIKEDVVEEVGRLYGYDKLPKILPKKTVNPSIIDSRLLAKNKIREKLSALGANEVMTYSFVHQDLLKKSNQEKELAFKINNALSPELQYYRLSLTPNLLSHIHPNIKANFDNFALFEIGYVHSKSEISDEGVPSEFGRVALVLADKNSKKTAFYDAKNYVLQLGLPNLQFHEVDEKLLSEHKLFAQMFAPYELGRSALITDGENRPLGVVGEFRMSVINNFKLPHYCAGFELFLSAFKNESKDYQALSKYPSMSQDLCLEVSSELAFAELQTVVSEVTNSLAPEDCFVNYDLIDIFSSTEAKTKKRVTFRFTMSSYSRTLTSDVLSSFISETVKNIEQKIDAKQI